MLATVALLTGQRIVAQQTQPPQFRAGTDIVPVDFLAYGPNGMPVTDLAAKEIKLTIDGREREIKSFQFVRLAATSVEAPNTSAPSLPLPFASNEGERPGRSIVIVIDHENIRAAESKAAIDAAKAFVNRLTPIDRLAVVTLPNGRIETDFTVNHARALKALETVVGRASRKTSYSNISLSEAMNVYAEVLDPDKVRTKELTARECSFAPEDSQCFTRVVQEALAYAREMERNTKATMQALDEFLTGLGGIEAPTAVLFLSGSLVNFPDTHIYMQDVARAASRARVQMYVIQPHEPILDAQVRDSPPSMTMDSDQRLGGLRDLAGITGGEFLRLTGTGIPVFTRIANEISSHYLLGFEPRSREQDGKPRKIQIQTTRRNVTIRARPTFVLDDPKRAGPTPMVLETLLRENNTRRDVPLRAAAFAFRDNDPKMAKVVVAIETADPAFTLTTAAFALIDLGGRSAAQWTEQGANVVTRPLVTAAAVPLGDYRLRVAVMDTAGRRGTVDYEFKAALTEAPPLSMASVMTGWLDKGIFRPRLLFGAADTSIAGYLEFYGNLPSGAELSSRLEIAQTEDGPALATAPGSVLGAAQATRFIATGGVPLAGIGPGDYVLRVLLFINDKPAGKATRTVRKLS